MAFELRDYQRQSVDEFYNYCSENDGNPLIVLPTGSGKSLVIAQLCKEIIEEHPAARILIVTHIKELIRQDFEELIKLWPQAPAGIYSAGLRRRDASAQILFGGIQSLEPHADEIGAFDLMICDEAHLIPHAADTRYRHLIEWLRLERPKMRVLGLTATAFRLDSGRLDKGENHLFDVVVHEAPVTELIEKGYLCKLISKATVQQLDLTGVHVRGGEYIPKELELAVDQEWITQGAVKEIMEFGLKRKAWLVFCTGVKHATHIRDALQERGVNVGMVLGTTPREERDLLTAAFKAGDLQCLVSINVLATGFNNPFVDLIALLRPTKSAGLFLQQVGRGLRNAPGKADCLILDFANLVRSHGPIDQITCDTITKAGDSRDDGEDKAKACPACKSLVALGIMVCPDCGYAWPVKKQAPKHEATADGVMTIVSNDPAGGWVEVFAMTQHIHRKRFEPDAPPSLCLEYRCGILSYQEYLAFEAMSDGARYYAGKKWRELGVRAPIPESAGEAVIRIGELKKPSHIRVQRNGKFTNVVQRRYLQKAVSA